MKKIYILLLAVIMSFALCACGKDKQPDTPEQNITAPQASNAVIEVKITPENLFDYFEYKEFPTYYKNTNDNSSGESVSSVQISYGFALKEGYTAARDPAHKDTMTVSFTADGVINSGTFDVDFDTLQYSGTTTNTERKTISETLAFWPKGDRTIIWPFGTYSDSYIIYLENFTVTGAKGSVFLLRTEPDYAG